MMQKAVQAKSSPAQSTATKSAGPAGSQSQSSERPQGNLSELASVMNQSSRVQTQFKLATEIQSASHPGGPGGALQRKGMGEKASPAQLKKKEKPAQKKGKLDEKKTASR